MVREKDEEEAKWAKFVDNRDICIHFYVPESSTKPTMLQALKVFLN